MAASKQKTESKREYVVVRCMRRGLSVYHTFHGPFTKGEAGAYATHFDTYTDGEFTVEHVSPLQHHEKWILRDVNA
jgi:hypothetical protein